MSGARISTVSKRRSGSFTHLRAGYNVLSLGVVDGDYFHTSRFDDVYGWDLEHCRRVIWQRQHDKALQRIQSSADLFEDRKQIPTFTRVNHPRNLDPIRDLLTQTTGRPLNALPELPPPPLSPEQLTSVANCRM